MAQCIFEKEDGTPCRGTAQKGGLCVAHGRMVEKKGKPETPPPAPDPEAIGGQIAQQLIAAENRARLDLAEARQVTRDKEGLRTVEDEPKRIPVKVTPKRFRPDATTIIDKTTGKAPASLKRGWVTRWVREEDHLGRPVQQRVQEFEDYGYQFIVDADNNPIRSPFGVAMQAPPQQYGLRAKERMPVGALNRHELVENAHEIAEEINRVSDAEVAKVVVGADHKSERFYHGGVEKLSE